MSYKINPFTGLLDDVGSGGGGGSGTVTSVSVTTANGVSGSVANATTTPAISLTLGAITPTTIVASGAISGSNLSGTNTGDQDLSNVKKRTIGFSASGTPTTGQQGSYVVFPVAGTITGFKIVANAGTCTVRTWKIASGTTAPTVSNNISTSGVSLSSGTAIISSTVTDFTTTAVAANDIFAFEITAVSGVTTLLFQLEITVS